MIRSLAFIEIVVSDFEAMLEWYTKVIGFGKGEFIDNEDGSFCSLTTSDGNSCIALWKPSDVSKIPNIKEKTVPSFFPILEVDNLHSFMGQLAKSGKVKILEFIKERTKYYLATIIDPEGNQLQLYEKRI